LYALLALLIAIGLCWLPWRAGRTYGYAPQPGLMLFALVGVIVAIGLWRVWGRDTRSLALAATALTSAALLTGALALAPALDVRPEAAFVAAAQRDDVPIVHVEWHNGLFGYTGRLHQPLPVVAKDKIVGWCRTHPRGILLASDASDEPQGVAPRVQWPYLLSGNHRIGAWSAADILASQKQ
ncbi:MAG: hypothetical protein ACREP1_09830, partial [Rhodanobacteraceae bacterium]